MPKPRDKQPLDAAARRNGWWVVAAFVGFIAALLLFPHSPLDGSTLCPFRHFTGYSCPGCGMTRACVSLARADIGASLHFHPLASLFVLVFGAYAFIRLLDNLKGRRVALPGRAWARANIGRIALFFLALILGFGGLRFFLELIGILTPV